MKCPSCGANISIRDEYCAWCGKPNDRAFFHVQTLRRYREQTDATREDLEKQTLKRVPVFIRLFIIGLLLVAFLIAVFIHSTAWERDYNKKEREAIAHAPEYCAALDEYVRNRDPLGFEQFIASHNINIYVASGDNRPYKKFRHYDSLAGAWQSLIFATMSYYPWRNDADGTKEEVAHRIGEYVNIFYSNYGRALADENEPMTQEMADAAADIEAQVRSLLVTYFSIDRAVADGIADMTEAERSYLIEEACDAKY